VGVRGGKGPGCCQLVLSAEKPRLVGVQPSVVGARGMTITFGFAAGSGAYC